MKPNLSPTPVVTIGVPVYNVGPFLRECLNSLQNQSYKNLEILLIDDGSTDESSAILDEFVLSEPRARLIRRENRGLAEARNEIIREARGDFLCFVDSDDWIDSDYVTVHLDAAIKNDTEIVLSGHVRVEQDGTRQTVYRLATAVPVNSGLEIYCHTIRERSRVVVVWASLFRMSFVRSLAISIPVGLHHEDEYLYPRLMVLAQRVQILPYTGYFYRMRSTSSMHNMGIKNLSHLFGILAGLNAFYDSLQIEASNKHLLLTHNYINQRFAARELSRFSKESLSADELSPDFKVSLLELREVTAYVRKYLTVNEFNEISARLLEIWRRHPSCTGDLFPDLFFELCNFSSHLGISVFYSAVTSPLWNRNLTDTFALFLKSIIRRRLPRLSANSEAANA